MRRTRLKVLLLALAFPVLGAVALAQEGAAGADLGARIAELRARAQRLTVLAQLPEEARPEVQALFDRFEDLRQSAQELEVARLEALVASLESGDSPAVAQQVAESAVADRRVELARQREALREDAEDLADRYPEAANLIRRLVSQRLLADAMAFGEGEVAFGAAPQAFVLRTLPGGAVRGIRIDGPEGGPLDRDAVERGRMPVPGLRRQR